MNELPVSEIMAREAFDRQSAVFDKIYNTNSIIDYKRERVRLHMEQFLKTGNHILELNAGTGEDAIYFARKGFHVHATDISTGMLSVLREKTRSRQLENYISSETCSFTNLNGLRNKGPFDYIFSNFAGLNCTDQLNKVFLEFPALLKPGGIVTLVILPRFCAWETLLLFRGKFKTAFRRFFSSKGRSARIEGTPFLCWYYNPAYVIRLLRPRFEVLQLEGLCTIVPPSYIEKFEEKNPRIFRLLKKGENRWKSSWPWRSIGDYYILSLRKKG